MHFINRTPPPQRIDEKELGARFEQRVGDITFWRKELDEKLAELKEELDEMHSQHLRVDTALKVSAMRITVCQMMQAVALEHNSSMRKAM